MNAHDVTVLIWVLLISIGAAFELIARVDPGGRLPTLSALFGVAMRSRSGRVGILAAWLWVGLHFFSR